MTRTLGQRADVSVLARERLDGAWGAGLEAPTDGPGPYPAVVTSALADEASSWKVGPDDGGVWLRAEPMGVADVSQGWKLHVSASLNNDIRVVSAVLPTLVRARVPWKVAASPGVLSGLNQGEAGLSQVGKFITIYPLDDAQAVRLALELDAVTAGMVGPVVPSDRRIRRGSLVSYRYGGFDDRVVEGALGELLPAIADPAGVLHEDLRGTTFAPPAWVCDPFDAAGLGEPLGRQGLIGDRYLPTAMLHRSPRGTVHLAVDLESQTSCVLKHAVAGAARSPWGTDALDSVRAEYANLIRVSGHPAVPDALDLVDAGDEAWLVLEYVDGVPLGYAVAAEASSGSRPDLTRTLRRLQGLVRVLSHVHDRGLVYRDLKPGNILLAADDTVCLVDFELALPVGSPGDGTLGSRGYCSPQQVEGRAASPRDDVFSLGAVMYLLLTGAEPALSPDPFHLTARRVRDLNPEVSEAMSDVVSRCLSLESSRRPQTPLEVLAAARRALDPGRTVAIAHHADDRDAPLDRHEVACRLAHSLAGDTTRWSDPAAARERFDASLYSGIAGEVFALAHLVSRLRTPDVLGDLTVAAGRLATWPQSPERGLYHGEAGVGVALVRAGHALGDPALVRMGARRVEIATSDAAPGLDLISGVAGQLHACLLLIASGLSGALPERAHFLARHLRDRASEEGGELWWQETPGATSGAVIGYAHGTSGIADVVLDYAELLGDAWALGAARSAAEWVERQAQPSGPLAGRAWADREGGRVGAPMWCHGATGVGRFLLHAAAAQLTPTARQLAEGALVTAAGSRAGLGPVLCHGLAGTLDLLLDASRGGTSSDIACLTRLLDAFAVDHGDRLVYLSDSPTQAPPSYLTGYGGIALTQLRLADSAEPTALSLASARCWPENG